jgi:hypothetical protein
MITLKMCFTQKYERRGRRKEGMEENLRSKFLHSILRSKRINAFL